MSNVRRTAMGSSVDMDILRLTNEDAIAIGNARTNARGDQLGPGGKVIKTRAQIMQEYHKMNAVPAEKSNTIHASEPIGEQQVRIMAQPSAVKEEKILESDAVPSYNKPRGSFAEAVAEKTEVTQELLEPSNILGANTPVGVKRI